MNSGFETASRAGLWGVARTFLTIFLPLAALVGALTTIIHRVEADQQIGEVEINQAYHVTMLPQTLVTDLGVAVSDLMILAGQRELQGMLEGDESELGSLADDFLSFCQRRKVYDQIRFLDERGMEVVRVNFNDGEPAIVPKDQLQFKGDRYYFQATPALEPREVYVSPFDLNVEHGQVEQPPKPMIRLGTPVFDSHGRKRGIVVLNYLGATMIHDLQRLHATAPGQLMLLNADGYWLKGPRPEDEWGFMYPGRSDRTFANAFPEGWQQISSAESGQFHNQDGLFTFTTVYPLQEGWQSSAGSDEAYTWKIVSRVSPEVLNAGSRRVLGRLLLLDAVLVLVLAAGSWFLARTRTSRKQAEWALGERVKELTCLYAVNRDMQKDVSVDELCRQVVEHLVPAMQFPEITVPVIELDGRRFTSERYTEELSHNLYAEIGVGDETRGQLWVYYTEDRPFLIPEEQNLLNGIAEALGLWLERKRAEEALAWEAEVNAATAALSSAFLSLASLDDTSSLVLETAQRVTGSEFGFVGYLDAQTGYLVSPTLTRDVWDSCQVEEKHVVFKEFVGLWGWVLDHRQPLLANAPAADPRSSGTPPGHVPIRRFLSAPAVIGDTLVGQVALANPGRDYTERDLALVERLAALYAVAVQRARAAEELREHRDHLEELVAERTVELTAANEQLQRNYQIQTVLNALLHISLIDIPLEELLELILDHILSIPGLTVESSGSIFLVEDEPEALIMKAQQGLEEPLQRECAQLPFGRCLCGRAASTREIQFADSLDDRHEIRYEGMATHGHYCVPILSGDRVLGVINLYLKAGHLREPREEELLTTIANTLAGIILRRQAQEAEREARQDYESLVNFVEGIVWEADARTCQFSFVSHQAERLLGYPAEQWIAEPRFWVDHIHPDDREWTAAFSTAATAEKRNHQFDYRMVAADGRVVWLRDIVTVVVEDDQPAKLQGVMVDITEQKRVEEERTRLQRRLEALWGMARMTDADYQTLSDHVLTEIVAMTTSRYGFYGFVDEDEAVMTLYSWSKEAMEECQIQNKPRAYPIAAVGLWGDAVRQRKALIVNDYQADHPGKKGVPEGHVALTRILVVPIFSNGRIVSLAAVANKAADYTPEDAEQINAFVTSAQAMLERRQAEVALRESEERYRTLFESTPEGIITSGPDGRILSGNPAAAAILGYESSEELVGMPAIELYPDPGQQTAVFEELMEKGYADNLEITLKRKDGMLVDVLAVVALSRDEEGNILRTEGLFRDITERKQMEAALEAERASLARRVEERTAELSVVNAELARAGRLKDEFLAAMSHELRTPLNAVLGLSEALQEEVYGPLSKRQMRSLSIIEESGRHLLALINDILDVSKIEAGEVALELCPVSIPSVCQASLAFIRREAHQKQIRVSSRLDRAVTTIAADERRLKQILVNLLSNAVKFTPEGGEVGLEVAGDPEREAVHLAVWDTGIGIAQEDMGRLFQPFVQLDSSLSRQFTGTGLGLALVRRLAEMHGGSVSVLSEVGKGSRFAVSLPWQDAAEEQRGRGAEEQERGGEPHIVPSAPLHPGPSAPLLLLADDSEASIEVMSDYLRHLGYRLIVARNGAEAVQRAREEQPDLILMDIQMPEMDGLEATRRLRADAEPSVATVPIIALTALAMPGDRERCLEAGANVYLSKPVGLDRLSRVIEEQLQKAESSRQ